MRATDRLEIRSAALARLNVTNPATGSAGEWRLTRWNGSEWTSPDGPADPYFAAPRVGGGRYVDPLSLAAVAASRLAAEGAPPAPPERKGCIVGTRWGNAITVAQCEAARLAGQRMSPVLFAHAGWNVPAALVAAELHCHGFTATVCAGTRCGEEALRSAGFALDRRRVDWLAVMVAGLKPEAGTDANPPGLQAFCLACTVMRRGGFPSPEWTTSEDDCIERLPERGPMPAEVSEFAAALGRLFLRESVT